ncbi:Fur family transcriptional regulator [Halanaerocella petrolearia]
MDQLSTWKDKLRSKGIRCTKQRCAILEVLIDIKHPISAQDIFARLKEGRPKLRLSTVYRNLNYFVGENIVRKLKFDEHENKFELDEGNHHHHLVCLDCEEVVPLDCPLDKFDEELGTQTGYSILEHRMKFYGFCPECQKKN